MTIERALHPDADPWWRTAVVYQIYPRSFADSDGDGVGDLRGILSRLDHLSALGVDVIWLSPVYPSPQDDGGYDISDYQGIDPLFGTLADMDALLDGVHARGMRLVMDLVVNHTSDEHAWFTASRSSREDPKRDWYWWRPPRPGTVGGTPGAEPNDWESFFTGSTWEFDEASGEYSLHLFSRRQPDLNWENPQVRAAVHAMMRWWLDRGVDGFRMDVVNLLSKDPALPDSAPVTAEEAARGGGRFRGAEHYLTGPRIHEFMAEMHREVFAGRPGRLLTVGETPGVSIEDARLFTDPARRELDMVFQFEHMAVDQGDTKWDLRPVDLPRLKAVMARWQHGLADVGWNSLYWDNHDQARAVSRFGNDSHEHRVTSAKTLATVLHLHRGTPFVYQGEELGMTNHPFTGVEELADIEAIRYHRQALADGVAPQVAWDSVLARGRDNARTPMQWDDGPQAGFTTGTPWLPVNPNRDRVNARAALADPGSVFHHYRALIAMRHTEPVLVDGDFTLLAPDHPRLWAFTRRNASVELLVVANVSGEPVGAEELTEAGVDLAAWAGAEVLLPTHPAGSRPGAGLLPWGSRMHRRSHDREGMIVER